MIKRTYFMSARVYSKSRGTNEFRYIYNHTTHSSIFPDSLSAFKYAYSEIEDNAAGNGWDVDLIEVLCFARC